MEEFRIDEGEKWDLMCTRRVSAGEDVEFFIRDAYLKVDGNSEDFEVMWQPSERWPCNKGREHIAYANARSGAQDWETER